MYFLQGVHGVNIRADNMVFVVVVLISISNMRYTMVEVPVSLMKMGACSNDAII